MKKTFNKILKLFLLVVTCFSTVMTASAETAPASLSITSYSIAKEPIPFPNTTNNSAVKFYAKKTTDGRYVHCVDYVKKAPTTSISYTKGSLIKENGINYILKKSYGVSNDTDFFKYQTALWIYMVDHGLMEGAHKNIDQFKASISGATSGIGKEIMDLVKGANSAGANDTSKPTISVDDSNIKFTLNGDYYVSDKIKVSSSTGSYDVALTNAKDIATLEKNTDGFIIKVAASKVSSLKTTISFKVSNSKTVYESYYYSPNNSQYQKVAATFMNTLTASDTGSVVLTRTTSVNISKQDITTSKEVSGAKLQLTDSNGKIIDEWISGTEPHKIENLPAGTYTLTETIAPEGYILSKESIQFTIDANGKLTDAEGESIDKVIMYNQKMGGASISKQDITTKEELPEAHLVVKDYDGNVIKEWISGTEPTYIELKPGIYTLTETLQPEGYILSSETITFTVKEDGSITKVVMYNTPDSKEVVEVEDTASFKTMTSTMIGLIVIALGMVLTFKNKKMI